MTKDSELQIEVSGKSIKNAFYKVVDEVWKNETECDNMAGPTNSAMKISVQTINATVPLLMSESVNLEMSEEIRRHSQKNRFVFKGRLLKNEDTTADDCGLHAGSIIRVVDCVTLEVHVEAMDGRKITLRVGRMEKISDVVDKLKKRFRFNRFEHDLQCKELVLLKYGRRIFDSGVLDGDVIKIVQRERSSMGVHLVFCDRRSMDMDINRWDTVSSLKTNIYMNKGITGSLSLVYLDRILDDVMTMDECFIEEEGKVHVFKMARNEILIFARTEDGKIVPLNIKFNISVGGLKDKIKYALIIADRELLFEGKILENGKKIDSYGIRNGSIIDVESVIRHIINVSVKMTSGNSLTLDVRTSQLIKDVKRALEVKVGIKSEEQELLFNGMVLMDDRTVEHYEIENGSIINVVSLLKAGMNLIVIIVDGRRIECDISQVGTITDLKAMLEERTAIPIDDQILIYEEETIQHDVLFTRFEGFGSVCINILNKTRDIFDINVVYSSGMMNILTIRTIDRLVDVKERIRSCLSIPVNMQVLRIDGRTLEDDNQLVNECGIIANCTVQLIRNRQMNILICSEMMESVYVTILLCDKIADLKKQIEEITGIPPEYQILVHEESMMCDDNGTVEQYNITSHDDIVVTAVLSDVEPPIRGVCLVISNENFTNGNARRIGTQEDERNIERTFQPLSYRVKIYRDVPSAQITEIINLTKETCLNDHRMLIVFVLSHGTDKGFIASDGYTVRMNSIWEPFRNDVFETLRDKPKVFFFSCCRKAGGNNKIPACTYAQEEIGEDFDNGDVGHPMAGMFIGYATCRYFDAALYRETGTLYVMCLCEVIREHSEWSLTDIHQEVQFKVSKVRNNPMEYFQLSYNKNALTKHAYFTDRDD